MEKLCGFICICIVANPCLALYNLARTDSGLGVGIFGAILLCTPVAQRRPCVTSQSCVRDHQRHASSLSRVSDPYMIALHPPRSDLGEVAKHRSKGKGIPERKVHKRRNGRAYLYSRCNCPCTEGRCCTNDIELRTSAFTFTDSNESAF